MKEKIENIDRCTFWILAISIAFIIYLLQGTTVGDILSTISFFSFVFIVLRFIYRLIRNSIELHQYKKQKKE